LKEEVSSGGIVVFGNTILLLKKYNGDWVLPKGRVEPGETIEEAAIREVMEETKVKATVIEYLGHIKYKFRSIKEETLLIRKTVHWYLMKAKNMNAVPQKSEGFIEVRFVHLDRVKSMLKYRDEMKIIDKAIDAIKEGKV
jgi:8-oxo-dGTP pyrophosphatase MutT (NUDIX family)